jgi:hypothetical protein
MRNVIPRSLQTSRTPRLVASRRSKLSELRSTTASSDPDPRRILISIFSGDASDMRDPDNTSTMLRPR